MQKGHEMEQERRVKFVRLANNRVNTAIKTIKGIGNLSNRSNYNYTEKDVDEIFTALNRELRDCQKRFKNNGAGHTSNFELK